jgi:large conductance mechanosensitive channel
MLKGFKEFIIRGNAIDLAVAFVLGIAFNQVVTSIVDGLINPLIAAIFGKPDLSDVAAFTINDAQFSIGLILTAVINFVLIAAAIYFLVVLPMNKLAERRKSGPDDGSEAKASDEVLLLTEIRDELRRRG